MNYRILLPVAFAALLLNCNNATGQQTDNNDAAAATVSSDASNSVSSDASAPASDSQSANDVSASTNAQTADPAIPALAQRLINAYPEQHLTYTDNHIVFPDGTKIVFDDGKQKSFEQMLDDCDIEDMLSMKYDPSEKIPGYLSDAGRARSEAFFKKMYGNNEAAVRKNLVKVNWFGQSLLFTKVNGADIQLKKVADEIAKHPELRKYMEQSSSFYWRPVRGAKRLSAHSYGMTIDICTKYSNYWLWSNKGAGETTKGLKYENRIPEQIVTIFEKYGFIWGGRWYHYDTMHFEYRPEIAPQ